MSDPLLKSEIHAERNTGILATGYDSRIQAYITGQGTPFASGYAKNHILRDLNRKLYNYGLSSYISDSYDAGFRSTTLTGILAAGGGGGSGASSSIIVLMYGQPTPAMSNESSTNNVLSYGETKPAL